MQHQHRTYCHQVSPASLVALADLVTIDMAVAVTDLGRSSDEPEGNASVSKPEQAVSGFIPCQASAAGGACFCIPPEAQQQQLEGQRRGGNFPRLSRAGGNRP